MSAQHQMNHHAGTYSAKNCSFADKLVRSLGLDGAIVACFENSWYGTLDIILSQGPEASAAE